MVIIGFQNTDLHFAWSVTEADHLHAFAGILLHDGIRGALHKAGDRVTLPVCRNRNTDPIAAVHIPPWIRLFFLTSIFHGNTVHADMYLSKGCFRFHCVISYYL